MATWHQTKAGPIAPSHSLWLVVVDPPGEFRFSVAFGYEDEAQSYAAGCKHAYVLAPRVTPRVTKRPAPRISKRNAGHHKGKRAAK